MKTTTRKTATVVALALGAGVLGGWLATRALADGVPSTPGSIYYAGEIARTDGAPVTSVMMTLRLFDVGVGGTALCTVDAGSVTVTDGHFRVPLDPAGNRTCLDALHANPTAFVELSIGGMGGETLPREQIGAVPYALEADRLVSQRPDRTDGVTAGGLLCGSTPAQTGNFSATVGGTTLHGYRAAHALCATACGSPTAHMCSGAELAMSEQLNLVGTYSVTDYGWYANGASAFVYATTGGTGDSLTGDCQRWTSSATTVAVGISGGGSATVQNRGSSWGLGGRTTGADADVCSIRRPITCCD